MAKKLREAKFRVLCKKCKKFYLPDRTKISRLGYCEKCRFVKGRCKFVTEIGYQCENDAEFSGYCMDHFLSMPMGKLKKVAKEL